MLSHAVKDPSFPPIPARHKVNGDIPQNNSESSALTAEINFVRDSTLTLPMQKNASIPVTDGFLTRAWRSIQAKDRDNFSENMSDEGGAELTDILIVGETLRQQFT